MNQFLAGPEPRMRALALGECLFEPGPSGAVWVVEQGAFRVERVSPQGGATFVQLAWSGDWLGVESLCAQPYSFRVTAMGPSLVREVDVSQEPERHRVLAQAYLQQQARAVEAAQLRSGPVASRVGYFLAAWSRATGAITQRVRDFELPYLRDIAVIVDSAPESVCRALGRLVVPRAQGRTRRARAPA